MEDYRFIKGYRNNESMRKSFNELASATFGISFEKWFEMGYWSDKYEPYSLLDEDRVIANASVNEINMLIHGEKKQAIQIGTVMTHPDYRKKGLSAFLMNKILEDYQQADLFYLFANNTVLDFYPKFGFQAIQEHQPIMEVSSHRDKIQLKKLDGANPADLHLIHRLAENRVPVSKEFSTTDTAELLMFYCMYVFPQDIYYWEKEEIVILMKTEGSELHLFDIISRTEIDLDRLTAGIASPEIERVHFHFTVDKSRSNVSTFPISNVDEVLFVKPSQGIELPSIFKHPITSQA